MIAARHYAHLCEAEMHASETDRYLVRFGDMTAGVYTLAHEDVADIAAYPGVDCVLMLTPGTNIDLDPRTLNFSISRS